MMKIRSLFFQIHLSYVHEVSLISKIQIHIFLELKEKGVKPSSTKLVRQLPFY